MTPTRSTQVKTVSGEETCDLLESSRHLRQTRHSGGGFCDVSGGSCDRAGPRHLAIVVEECGGLVSPPPQLFSVPVRHAEADRSESALQSHVVPPESWRAC